MKVGIIGNAADKFTELTGQSAKVVIRRLLNPGDILVSGGCHLGGVDIWAEEIAKLFGCYDPDYIHLPKIRRWEGGYKQRNLKIARDSDILHVIVVTEYPPEYRGRRFTYCYHCDADDHIKSGACWTGKKATKLGKSVMYHIIGNNGDIFDEYMIYWE